RRGAAAGAPDRDRGGGAGGRGVGADHVPGYHFFPFRHRPAPPEHGWTGDRKGEPAPNSGPNEISRSLGRHTRIGRTGNNVRRRATTSSRRRHVMKWFTRTGVLLALLVLGGCATDASTAPEDVPDEVPDVEKETEVVST